MPRRDGTGPMGLGARQGRGMGYCNTSRENSNTYGYGFGRGFGMRGCMNLASYGNNKELLIRHKTFLENKLQWVNKLLENTDK